MDWLSIQVSPAAILRTHLTSRSGEIGVRDYALDPLAVEFYGVGLVVLRRLNNNLQLRRTAEQLRNGIDRAGDQLALDEQDHVGGKALDGAMKTCQAIGLCDHLDIVFECENLLDAYPIYILRIGQDDANQSAIPAFVVTRFNTRIVADRMVHSSDALRRIYPR